MWPVLIIAACSSSSSICQSNQTCAWLLPAASPHSSNGSITITLALWARPVGFPSFGVLAVRAVYERHDPPIDNLIKMAPD